MACALRRGLPAGRGRSTSRAVDCYQNARIRIDQAHAADPKRTPDGRPAELVYADRIEAWVLRLVPDADAVLRLAARCQHLERWVVPRDTFPLDRAGYHAWRKSLYVKQAERAREILLGAGVPENEAAAAATWVSKTGLKTNPGTQALEDAACLVFLENEIAEFAAAHADYDQEKFVGILRRTWAKMSEAARSHALGLQLAPEIDALVRAAVGAGSA